MSGEASPEGAMLAYEHKVRVDIAADLVQPRVDAVRAACRDERFGTCSLLAVEVSSQQRASGSITLRVAPQAVEPLIELAAEAGELGARTTRAEDLADEVLRTTEQLERAERHQRRMIELSERPDLSVADHVSLSKELSRIEVELELGERESAMQRRRIETNLLSIAFSAGVDDSIAARFSGMADTVVDEAVGGSVEAVAMFFYLLPFLLLLFPVALAWRWGWRRMTGASRTRPRDLETDTR